MDFARMPLAGRWPFLRLGAVPGEAWEAGERPNQRIDKLLFSGETPLRTVIQAPGSSVYGAILDIGTRSIEKRSECH